MTLLKRAFLHHENNSMMLLARSKQTMHSFISAITEQVKTLFKESEDQSIADSELKVIRVNSILSNSETKILMRLSDSLRLRQGEGIQSRAQFQSVEMIETIKDYFKKQPKQAVLFVLEDIDYYVETTKQVLLYKILDMFGYLSEESNVRFVFLATSVKVDLVDQFEKRIKSRFSHRMTLFYEQTLEKFEENLISVFNQLHLTEKEQYRRDQISTMQAVVQTDETKNALEYEY